MADTQDFWVIFELHTREKVFKVISGQSINEVSERIVDAINTAGEFIAVDNGGLRVADIRQWSIAPKKK